MSTSRGCKPHYFSIENLLATEEAIPCTFLQNERCIGFLEPGSTSDHISTGTILQLPYWIATCFTPYLQTVHVDLPKVYKKVYRDVLTADAKVVDLKRMSRFYYLFGMYLIKLKNRESPEIKLTLYQTFRERFRMILDWAQNVSTDLTLTRKLDKFEIFIFENCKVSQDRLSSWLKCGTGTLEATSMVVGYKKRKITDEQVF